MMTRYNDDFFTLCHEVSQYAKDRKRGFDWFYIFVSPDEEELRKRCYSCVEDDGRRLVLFKFHALLKDIKDKEKFANSVCEMICP